MQWKGQKWAGKILLTWTKSLLVGSFLNQKARLNHQLIAEMFVFFRLIASVDEELKSHRNNRVYPFLAGNWYRPETGQHTVCIEVNKCNQNTANEIWLFPRVRLTSQSQGDSKSCSWTEWIMLSQLCNKSTSSHILTQQATLDPE